MAEPKLSSRLLDGVFENLSRAEFRLRAGVDLHRLPGTGIAAHRSLAARYGEISEADKTHFIAPLCKESADRGVSKLFDYFVGAGEKR